MRLVPELLPYVAVGHFLTNCLPLNVMPHEVIHGWRQGLKVEPRATDTHVAVAHGSHHQHQRLAAAEVSRQVEAYARANDLIFAPNTRLSPSPPWPMTADVQLARFALDTRALVSLAAFEIEAPGRTGPQMIEHASAIVTTFPQVECVVCFKFYAPRAAFLAADRLCVPALAIVFRRGTTDRESTVRGRRLRLVRIEQMVSFGNSGIDQNALRVFMTHSQPHGALLENPSGDFVRLMNAPVAFPDALDVSHLTATLPLALATAQATAPAFVISLGTALPPLCIDLPRVFVAAMEDWARRPRTHQCGVPDGDAAAAAPPGPVGRHDEANGPSVAERVVAHVRALSWKVACWMVERIAVAAEALEKKDEDDEVKIKADKADDAATAQ